MNHLKLKNPCGSLRQCFFSQKGANLKSQIVHCVPGSGIALDLFQMVKDNQSSINVVILSKFCEEGDNTRDGVELADYSNILMSWMSGTKYSVPHSWRLLFGAPAPSEMFW